MELQISMNIRYYYTFDNSLLFTESIQNTTQNLSTLNHNVRFLRCRHRGRWHNAIRVRAKPVCIVLIIPETLPQRLRQGWT